MSGFVIFSGLLLIGVLIFLLRPLLMNRNKAGDQAQAREANLEILREQRRELEREHREGLLDQAAYDQALKELERRTLEDTAEGTAIAESTSGRKTGVAIALGVALIAGAVVLYAMLGDGKFFGLGADKQAQAPADGSHALTPQQIQAMVERLSERLQSNPNDGQGWLMLARSYGVLGRYHESAAAYGRAIGLLPPDAQNLADFADTVAMTQGRKLQGDPERLVRMALEIDPRHVKALALSGTIAFERQDYRTAINEWQKILAVVPPDSPVVAGMQGSIRDAESRLAASGGTPTTKVADSAAPGVAVSGTVALDPALAGKFSPSDTVFVFARAESGPKMPLAILRKTVADLPLKFKLDDSMAMAPNMRLSQYKKVVVGARVSKTGDAIAVPGDWQGISAAIEPGGSDLKIVINSEVK